MNLVKRVAATQKTVDQFKGREFIWGKADCARLVILHARHLGRKIKIPAYGDVMSARKAIRQLGFKNLGAAMDSYFTKIGSADVLAGDFVALPGTDSFLGLCVAVGNGRVLGFHEDIPHADILQPMIIAGAWRVE